MSGISRRTALYGLAAGVAGAVVGCSETRRPELGRSTQPPEPSASSEVLLDGDETATGWEPLRKALGSRLILPSDRGYAIAKRAYNPLFDARKPAAVARAAWATDVQKCVDHARENGLRIAARSGGHSYAGNSTPNGGLVVDLSAIRSVKVRPDGTAVIGAGARLGDVYRTLAAQGRCLPGGSCPTVGIGGLTLGGGIGVLTRKYGLTCDRLSSAKVVTADGRLIVAWAEEHRDLFWALRGGGGGNFGIVTHFTFRTAAAPTLTVFGLRFPAGSAGDVLGGWQDWIADAPRELWSNLVVSGGSPSGVRVGGCHVGSVGSLNPLLDRLIRATGVRPTNRFADTKDYLDTMRYFAGSPERQRFTASSRVIAKPLRNPSALVNTVRGQAGTDLLIDALGGAVAAKAPEATAFPHRKALATVQIYSASSAKAVQEVRDELGRVLGARGYVNYIDRTMPSWAKAYYGPNAARLKRVAETYDPQTLFDFPQNVAHA